MFVELQLLASNAKSEKEFQIVWHSLSLLVKENKQLRERESERKKVVREQKKD